MPGSIKFLKACLDEVISKYPPKKDYAGQVLETYCNIAVREVASQMGYRGFSTNMTANLMVEKMGQDWAFAPIDMQKAQALALDGNLVIGGVKGDPHGHVSVVYPDKRKLQESAKWGNVKVPWVGNVGKDNGVMSANYAFGKEPKWFVFISDPDRGVA